MSVSFPYEKVSFVLEILSSKQKATAAAALRLYQSFKLPRRDLQKRGQGKATLPSRN